jgi:hypothetical protein
MRKSNKRPGCLASRGDQPFGFGSENEIVGATEYCVRATEAEHGRPVGGHGFRKRKRVVQLRLQLRKCLLYLPSLYLPEGVPAYSYLTSPSR